MVVAEDWDDFDPNFGRWQDDIQDELRRAFLAAWMAQYGVVTTRARDLATQYALARAGELIGGKYDLGQATRDRLKEMTAQAIDNGYSTQQLAAGLRDDLAFSPDRARTIARTETATALGKGNRAAAEEMSQDEKSWQPGDSCDECMGNGDDGWIDIDDSFSSGDDDIPAHPNCLPGDSLVASIGCVTASSERWYEGDLVIIRISTGKQLACTPNHPILTPTGWVAARLLNVGGYVICAGFGQGKSSGANDNAENMPSRIEDVAKSLGSADQVATAPVPITAEDFHGDGKGSEVAVIRANRLLVDRVYPALIEKRSQSPLGIANVQTALLNGERVPHLFIETFMPTAHSSMGGSGVRFADVLGHPFVAEAYGGAVAADCDSGFDEDAGYDAPADAIAFAEQEDGVAGTVFFDKLVDVRREPFSGHVYNLQTESGMYVAEGIITHNCTCDVIYRTKRVHESAPPVLLKVARCSTCRRKLGEDVNAGARLWCPRCKAEAVIG